MKKKIYVVSWNGVSNAGGVERVTQFLLSAWENEYDVEVIDYLKLEKNKIAKSLLHKHHVMDAIIASLYMRQLKRKDPDCKVVIQGFNCPFVKADLAIAHGSMRGYKLAMGDKRWHLNQLFEKIGMNHADRVVAVSNTAKNEITRLYGVDPAKVIVIENCVDTDNFFPINRQEDGCCKILFAGRLEDGKGIQKVLELAMYIEKMDNYRMLIATNNSENIELFKNLKNTEIYVGLNAKKMNEFYNSGNVLFFPSKYEGFELVTLEALATGIPIVGRNVGAIGDLYSRKYKGVKLVGASNEENLAIINKLYHNYLELDTRMELHNNVERDFSIEKYKEKIKELWK